MNERVFFLIIGAEMKKKSAAQKHDQKIIDALTKIDSPIYDKKHNLYVYLDNNQSRSNETRFEHIAKFGHDLKVSDINVVKEGINNYLVYKKDPVYKQTFNYYLLRRGDKKGFIKISIQIDSANPTKAWVKTIFITYRIK